MPPYIAHDYDGKEGERSDAAALFCDPDQVLYEVNEDGEEVLPRNEKGEPQTIYPGRSKTIQSEAAATDINAIVKRMEVQGVAPAINRREGAYLDCSRVPDFRGALEQVRHASEYFQTLPGATRALFHNNIAEFLDAVKDNSRLDDLIKAGIVNEDEVVNVPDVGTVQARDDETGRYQTGREPADEVAKRNAGKVVPPPVVP